MKASEQAEAIRSEEENLNELISALLELAKGEGKPFKLPLGRNGADVIATKGNVLPAIRAVAVRIADLCRTTTPGLHIVPTVWREGRKGLRPKAFRISTQSGRWYVLHNERRLPKSYGNRPEALRAMRAAKKRSK